MFCCIPEQITKVDKSMTQHIFLLTVTALHCLTPPLAYAQSVRIEDVVAAWRQRSDRNLSVDATWMERRTEVKGWKKNPAMPKAVNPDGLTIPPADTVTENESRFVMQGSSFRYSVTDRKRLNENLSAISQVDQLSVFDGVALKQYYAPWLSGSYPQGNSTLPKTSPTLPISYLKPILWTFRPMSSGLFTDSGIKAPALALKRGSIDGRDCDVIERALSRTTKEAFWVDRSKMFNIVRYTYHANSIITIQFDVSYKFDKNVDLWLPESWKYNTVTSDGSPRLSATATYTLIVAGKRLEPDLFQLDFPVGTWVSEDDSKMFIQRPNNERRDITEKELGLDYKDYLSTESGMAKKSDTIDRLWFSTVFIVFCVILVSAIAYVVVRRRATK